jgi:hypothetical protein
MSGFTMSLTNGVKTRPMPPAELGSRFAGVFEGENPVLSDNTERSPLDLVGDSELNCGKLRRKDLRRRFPSCLS